ncbi:MAG: L-threonate dehydrogenase [Pseudomonadota bacterium]
MSTNQTAAVIGLGSMGYGIALSLVRGGHKAYGYDVNAQQIARFVGDGGAHEPLKDVASALDVVLVAVLNAAQTRTVLFGEEGVVPHLRDGAVVVACATVAPDFAREMETACAKHSVHYLDAPISGGSVKAAQGALTIMASGISAAFAAAQPVLDTISEKVFALGDAAGAGSAMKAVNQLLAGVHIAAMAEALTFGMTQRVKPDLSLDVIRECAGTSWMLENRAPHIVAGDYTPHSVINIWPKDLGIVLDIAKEAKFDAPITAAALQQFVAASAQGLGGEDDAAVAKVYARNAGLCLPGET